MKNFTLEKVVSGNVEGKQEQNEMPSARESDSGHQGSSHTEFRSTCVSKLWSITFDVFDF